VPSRFWRPAARRTLTTFGVLRLVGLLLIASLSWAATAYTHEGQDHAPPPSSVTTGGLPRLTLQSEAYELVAVLKDDRLTIYLDRFEDNTPVVDAKITVMIEGDSVMAEPVPDGTYVLTSNLFRGRDTVELVFDLRAPAGDDLLIGRLSLPSSASTKGAPGSWWGQLWSQAWSAMRDHPVLIVVTLALGIVLGLAPRYYRSFRLPALLLLAAPLLTQMALNATAEPAKGANGGDVVVMENHPIEFVSKGQEITFYILDEDGQTPVSTAGLTGRAVVQDGGKTTAVNLSPAEPNRFVGQLQMPLGPRARVVFSAKVAGHNLQARFTTP
jgi:hypothetical protein